MILLKKRTGFLFCLLLSMVILFSGVTIADAYQPPVRTLFKETSTKGFVTLHESNDDGLIDRWDWRNVDDGDWTTPIRNQIQDVCGSCWAFGALGGLESNYKIWMNNPNSDIDLSEQYILSCSPGGCSGWYLQRTLSWIKHNGIIFEECMPYEANDTIPCESKCDDWRDNLFGITDYEKVSRGNITAIKEALLTYGPLPSTMSVYTDFYPDWNGDVYQQTSEELVFGHVITIVGFDDTWGNVDEGYWICKNSWGTEWGEEGWFRIAYGECDIENSVYYFKSLNHPPNKPETPIGESEGKPNVEYTFSSSCTDEDGNDLFYLFDWGDGNQSDWIGPFASGETVDANYSWREKGIYSVKVKTMDFFGPYSHDYGMEGEWSDPLEVSMPKSKQSNNPFLMFLRDHSDLFQLFQQFFLNNNQDRVSSIC